MRVKFFENQAFSRWICLITITILPWFTVWGQSEGESTAEELTRLGFENVRWTENKTERIYTIENGSTHRSQMQRMGLVRMQN